MATFTTPQPITATITTAGALVRIIAADRADTVVRVEPVNSANKKNVQVAERTKVDFTGGVLAVKTTKSGDRSGSVAITVELPSGSRVVLNTAWTDVDATGALGDCEVNIASGRVRLDHVTGLRCGLGSGGVEVGFVGGHADVESSSAGVRIEEVAGLVRYQGATGRVWIGHARGDVELSSASGAFEIGRADGGVTVKAANCPIKIGRVTRGQVELTNASGGIEVGVGDGVAALVDAKSTKGVVRSFLPEQDQGGDAVRIYARTRLDDIVIRRAVA